MEHIQLNLVYVKEGSKEKFIMWSGLLQTGEEYFIFEVLLSRMVERSTADNDMNLRIWYKNQL